MNPDIFTEAFLSRLLPLFHEVTLGAIRHFTFEQYPANAALAAIGAQLASVVLYAIGVWLRRMPERVSTEGQRTRIENMRGVAREWLPWLLVLAPTPLGGIIIMAAAFFRLNAKMVAMIIIVTEIVFRAMPYLR
jgi:membrane protein YqaA with SNARE-associated domain